MILGVFGGTFAPFHRGHEQALRAILASGTDRCIVIPTGQAPHRETPSEFSDTDRLTMTKLAVRELGNVIVDDLEIKRGGLCYTVDTLRELKRKYPDASLRLLLGSDQFLAFSTWHEPEEICKLAELAVLPRETLEHNVLPRAKERFEKIYGARIQILDAPFFPISSTDLRARLNQGDYCSEALNPSVLSWILLKREGQFESELAFLSHRLPPNRLAHSLGVARMAGELADRNGADRTKLMRAGLLHDATKYLPREEHIRLMLEFSPDEQTIRSENLHHAVSGAAEARHLHGLAEKYVQAIRYHTTAKANMTAEECILYLSDLIDETRTYDDVDFYRLIAREDIYKAAYLAILWCIDDLKRRSILPHPDMLAAAQQLSACYPSVTIESEKTRLYHKGETR